MATLEHIGADVAPLLHDLIVQGPGRACGARQRQRAELQLAGAARRPRSPASIAIDARRQLPGGSKLDRVPRAVVRRQRLAVTALELDQLPRRALQAR